MTGLADHQWRRRFSSSLVSLLEGFYKPALMEATWGCPNPFVPGWAVAQQRDGVLSAPCGGNYEISITADDFVSTTLRVTLKQGEQAAVVIRLERRSE